MAEMKTHIHVNDGNVTFESVQDCTSYLDKATSLHNEGHHGSSEMRHAAHFPAILVEKYCHQKNILFSEFMSNREHVRAMLGDPTLSGFRVWKGAV